MRFLRPRCARVSGPLCPRKASRHLRRGGLPLRAAWAWLLTLWVFSTCSGLSEDRLLWGADADPTTPATDTTAKSNAKTDDKQPAEPHSWPDEICKQFCPWHADDASSNGTGTNASASSNTAANFTAANSTAANSAYANALTPVAGVTGTIAGAAPLSQTPFTSEESPSFVASFAPPPAPPASDAATTNPVPPSPNANPPAAKKPAADSASAPKEKDKDESALKVEDEWTLLPKGWNAHAQTTLIDDFQPGFGAKYSGPNSLGTARDREGTITADIFLGAPLWQGAEFHADLLMWQGFGLSNSFGLEAFPNADAYKSGSESPRFMFSHFFIRQTIGLGGEQEDVPDGQFTLPGKRDISRLTITAGRLNMAELFDQNTYNHDPHTQFMSWASTMLSWDYPADTIGYTTGLAFDLNQRDWALRYGWFQLPGMPNGFTSDDRIFMYPVEPGEITSDGNFWKEWGMITELERRWHICEHPGAVRLQAWIDHGLLADYNAATAFLVANPPVNPVQGVETTVPGRAFSYRSKYGFGLNWEQEIANNIGLFSRIGWQDGETAAAAFNDVDWTFQFGISIKGAPWHRPHDTFGLLGNLAGASSDQQAFLKAGGTGILNGDGNLTYACEKSLETYYDIALGGTARLAFDYQFFADPAFNSDRGPVSVFGVRLHWEI
jgi:high affinity Mn2+ porin